MELKYAQLSPYVRKVLVVAHELGLASRIRLTAIDTRAEPDKIAPTNPLGKIPVLVTDSGAVLYDSPVICEYLDAEFGGHRFLPASGLRRWEVMTRVALADGIMDAAILVRQERARAAERQSAEWIEWQLRKVNGALDRCEATMDISGDELDMGRIALGCALGYVPLRLPDFGGLPRWPRLAAWYEALLRRPSFQRTTPVV
jgi:glutathione S-transferase